MEQIVEYLREQLRDAALHEQDAHA